MCHYFKYFKQILFFITWWFLFFHSVLKVVFRYQFIIHFYLLCWVIMAMKLLRFYSHTNFNLIICSAELLLFSIVDSFVSFPIPRIQHNLLHHLLILKFYSILHIKVPILPNEFSIDFAIMYFFVIDFISIADLNVFC